MPINDEQLKALGAQILAADNDKFGLKTDGKGNVIISAGSSFMEQALKLKQKYLILADENHDDTFEQVLSKKNVLLMKSAGVARVFMEQTPMEFDFVKKIASMPEYRIAKRAPIMRSFVEQYKNLQSVGIEYVTSDPREKYSYTAEREINIEHLAFSERILSQLRSETGDFTGKPFLDIIANWRVRHDIMHDSSESCKHLKRSNELALEYLKERQATAHNEYGINSQEYLAAIQDIKEHERGSAIILGGKNTPYSKEMAQDVEGFYYNILVAKAVEQLNKSISTIDPLNAYSREMGTNKALSTLIMQQSSLDKKVVIRWGAGHFTERRDDVDEMLNETKTIVIGTVVNTEELNEKLSNMKYVSDPVDYMYMPERTENGKLIPEKVISVAEYLAAQEKKEKAPEVQKATGRG
jgi:hypothetical protein